MYSSSSTTSFFEGAGLRFAIHHVAPGASGWVTLPKKRTLEPVIEVGDLLT